MPVIPLCAAHRHTFPENGLCEASITCSFVLNFQICSRLFRVVFLAEGHGDTDSSPADARRHGGEDLARFKCEDKVLIVARISNEGLHTCTQS